jgi:O-antigen/teichoic acid export membrane protein
LLDSSRYRLLDTLRQRPALSLVIGRSFGFVAAFAIPIVLTRVLDQAEFGTYKQLFLVYSTLFGLAQLGMAESLYYFIPKHSGMAGQHIANAVLTLAGVGIVSLTLLMLSSGAIAGWLTNPQIAAGVVPLGVFLALTLVTAPLEIVLVSRGRYTGAALTYAASDLVRVACLVTPGVLIGTVSSVMWGAVGYALARVGAMLWVFRREVVTGFRADVAMWRGQLTYALPFALAVGVEIVQANFHQYVVATRFDAATFAIFAVGVLQIPLIDVIATSVANVMMVKMSGEGSGDPRKALALWHDTTVRMSLVVFPLVAFMLVAARDIIVLVFTDAYLASVPVFQLSAFAILPTCLCVDAVLRAHAQTKVLFGLNLLRLGTVALLIGWFLTAFGLPGAVAATLCATVLARALGLARIGGLLGVGLVDLLPWKRLTMTAAFAAVAALPAMWVHGTVVKPGLFELLMVATVYSFAFVVLCAWNGSLSWFALQPAPPSRGARARQPLRRRLVEPRPANTE